MAERFPARAAKQAAISRIFESTLNEDIQDLADVLDDADGELITIDDPADGTADDLDDLPREILVRISRSDDDNMNSSSDDEDDVQDDESANEAIWQDSEQAPDDNEGLTAPSGLQWSKQPPNIGREPARNIISGPPIGPSRGIHPSCEREAFLMFTDDIFDESVRFTNLEGRRIVTEWNRNHDDKKQWISVDRKEMESFIGLHILAGVYKAQYRNVSSLYSERDGHPVFRATMSMERFLQLKRAFRVDDRCRRDPKDPLAPVRNVLDIFLATLTKNYVPHEYLTIDEQLMEFHGRVKFRQYIASKPGKFGIKIIWLCDAITSYALNAIVYIGSNTLSERDLQQATSTPEAVVMKLIQPYHGSGRGITTDNWFTSVPLAVRLKQSNMTLLGTIRSNRRDIPPAAKLVKGRQKKTAEYYYAADCVLCSYYDKSAAPVLLLSTEHRQGRQGNKKPEIIEAYNSTKSGVDNMDRMIRFFSCKRKCFRWSYEFLCNLFDVAAINSLVIMNHLDGENSCSRYDFLINLGFSLVAPHIRRRQEQNLSKRILTAMSFCGFQQQMNHPQTEDKKRGRCVHCARALDRKVIQKCSICNRFLCAEHTAQLRRVCADCIGDSQNSNA